MDDGNRALGNRALGNGAMKTWATRLLLLAAALLLDSAGSPLWGQSSGWTEADMLLARAAALPGAAQAPAPPPLSGELLGGVGPGNAGPDMTGTAAGGEPILPSDVQSTIDVWEATMGRGMPDFRGYRDETSSTSWIVGDGQQFGLLSFNFGTTFHRRGVANGLGTGFQWHLLSGPDSADLPPRVYDFLIGYQARDWIGTFGYDIAGSVSASSDFEGSARDGIRYPSHAVGYLRLSQAVDLAFGVDYIDREDVGILPVGGLVLRPNGQLLIQAVFPRPRLDISLSPTQRLYISGDLGGGQWAIEREQALVDDLLTYSDLRLAIGTETTNGPGVSGMELAWVFHRKIEFSSGVGNLDLDDTLMIRFVHSK